MQSTAQIVIFLNNKQTLKTLNQRFADLSFDTLVQIENVNGTRYNIKRSFPFKRWYVAEIVIAILVILFLLTQAIFTITPWSAITAISAVALFLVGNIAFWIYEKLTIENDPLIQNFKPLVLTDETLVLVECNQSFCRQFINILQKVQEEPIIFYVLTEKEQLDQIRAKELLPQTPLNQHDLEQQAERLARIDFPATYSKNYSKKFLSRVQYIAAKYQSTYEKLNDYAQYNENIHLSAEWLLDNSFNVKQALKDIQKNLPEKFFKELPFFSLGPYQGIPRIYSLASKFVAVTDGKVNEENITSFISAYQKVTPLTIGELWAFPLVVKIRLIECLLSITKSILDRTSDSQLAGFWGNRILNASRREPEKLYSILAALSKEIPQPNAYFAEQLLIQIGDDEVANSTMRAWLQRKVKGEINDLFEIEQSRQMLEQTSLGNTIISLHRLTQMNWREVFEELSIVDGILSKESLGVYSKMDFSTRDRYRHVIEKLSRSSKQFEIEVAKEVVKLTDNGTTFVTRHVGYYLIDDGQEQLEAKLGIKTDFIGRVANAFIKHNNLSYFSVFTVLTFALLAIFEHLLPYHLNPWVEYALILLSVIPISEAVLQVINYIIVHFLAPNILPKMSYKDGLPASSRTLVVIPMMLISEESIQKELDRLEVHFLANSDPNILFALVSDYKDAPAQSMPEDVFLLKTVFQGIKALNEKYKRDQFYLFHRERQHNPCEGSWMGWERKRGKLEHLNRYLSGETATELDEFLQVGEPLALTDLSYVLTVDSDTQLPKNSVRCLVETITHPLNQPVLDESRKFVTRGYTIIQPRVSTNYLSSNATWFSNIFSDPSGIDPYSKSVSDIYQDVFNEGVYHGKGLYDFKIFHQILTGRFPENQILSHDLLEGSFVRTAFTSDIELHDSFPETYVQFCKRQHRWIRGDWQIINWLGRTVYDAKGRPEKNELPFINRWKIFDNLKRSLFPISIVLLLILAWISKAPLAWTVLAFGVALLPILLQTVDQLWNILRTGFGNVWADMNKGVLRTLTNLAFLPHQALVNADAICSALYRQHVSRKLLLQWEVASSSSYEKSSIYIVQLWMISFLAIGFAVFLGIKDPISLSYASPFLVLWALSPIICNWLGKKFLKPKIDKLSPQAQQYIRLLSRKTWRFFDDLITQEVNWLPPDNIQEKIRNDIAYRTSPTNIGFYMMSILSSKRLGYLTLEDLLQRLTNVQKTLRGMERFEGHFLNWYDIKNLQPLLPRYVSTVDSGNLLASLWTVEQACREILNQPVFNPEEFISGIEDVLILFEESLKADRIKNFSPQHLWELFSNLRSLSNKPLQLKNEIDAFQTHVKELLENLRKDSTFSQEGIYWLGKLNDQLESNRQWMNNLLPWLSLLELPIASKVLAMHPEGFNFKQEIVKEYPVLQDILDRNLPGVFSIIGWLQSLSQSSLSPEMSDWVKAFIESINKTLGFIEDFKNRLNILIDELSLIGSEMNLTFLYNPQRKLFSIGYNVTDRRLDNSYYDLLASEARLTSFVAIARGDVPLEHWWMLGRPLGNDLGHTVLLSWNGTMFEYLMPVIWCKNYENTLLDYACKMAVQSQIAYAKQRGFPWGISEAAYSRLDLHNIYQYRAFGVPSLGLKRGLEKDFVVTPYSSALALMIDPQDSVKNLKRLDREESMNGIYGLYEAIDYSREYRAGSKWGIIIHAFMGHHLGMTITSCCNTLFDGYLQNLFHDCPRVKAVETILYERLSITTEKIIGRTKEPPYSKLAPTLASPVTSNLDTPNTQVPVTHLLSNGNYSVMITNSGGGYSRYQDIDITRWRADFTKDSYGSFIYIRDVERNVFFSAAYHPLRNVSSNYYVNFSNHKAEIRKRDFGIDSFTEIVVSPEDNIEIRFLTLTNLSMRQRTLELTSYVEIALATHNADRAHPAFSKMFIQTEAIEGDGTALLAHRQKRSPEDKERWCFHVVAFQESGGNIQFETNRETFIGRGRNTSNPQGLYTSLSNSQGCVLDPIFALRKKVILDPGKKYKASFIVGYADSRDEALRLIEKYKSQDASIRSIDLSWARAELDLRRLHITQEDAKVYQRLANMMIYPDSQLRAPDDRLKRNRLGQEKLWSFGISGDNPILLITIGDLFNLDVVHSVLQAHTFWSLRGLKTDVVIMNEEMFSYEKPLEEHLLKIIQNYAQYTGVNKSGGIFLVACDKMNRDDQNLLFTVAHAVIVAERGSLSQQMAAPRLDHTSSQRNLSVNPSIPEQPSPPLPFLQLLFFNGIGGFTTDGKEYAIYLGNDPDHTPAPWINVCANRNFGFLASEQGIGMTWSGNSQMNRLSPWSNDPVSDPITDVCFIRDDETGTFWTMTPSPVSENDPYRTRHGQGYTIYEHNSHAIEQEMTVFTPIDDSHPTVRIQIIRLKNHSSRTRKISLFPYCELTMGTDREESQRYVVTHWNYQTNSLMASNHYRNVHGDRVAFISSSPLPNSFTDSRKEFIGRNGSLAFPHVLKKIQLSQAAHVAQDPCFALQTTIELFSGETTEILVILGDAPHNLKAKELVQRYQNHEVAIEALEKTKDWWDKFLTRVQVYSPDKSLDVIFNRWLIYQTLSCRVWARSAFYQSGGAVGFRDQIQDGMAIIYFDSAMTREHILRCASRQFLEGDVQHWWHPDNGSGVRTKISDDLLWLPYAAMQYVEITNDQSVMEEKVAYLEGRLLEPGEHEAFVPPKISEILGTVEEHCIKAIDRSLAVGPHGLPLIGGGDWNDGMNLVGVGGKGESVWLAWFLIDILNSFSKWLIKNQKAEKAREYEDASKKLLEAIESQAWDGEWYIRAFFDNGDPIGSKNNSEDKIDSLPQTWSVISGQKTERSKQAMKSVDEHLVDEINKMVLLFTPPYEKSEHNPGYIKGYPAGVRENGGQYTHAAAWVAKAYAKSGNPDKAMEIIHMLNPINRSQNKEEREKYRVEPYVTVADVYALKDNVGRGGWTWYTGSASVIYRVILEDIFGFSLRGETLTMNPVIPAAWDGFTLTYRHGEAEYEIKIENPKHVTSGVEKVMLDGKDLPEKVVPLVREAGKHSVVVTLG